MPDLLKLADTPPGDDTPQDCPPPAFETLADVGDPLDQSVPDGPPSQKVAAELDRLAELGQPEPSPAVDEDPALTGKIVPPELLPGAYVVLWARVPRGRPAVRPRYEEVGYFKASSPEQAKAMALEHDGRSKSPFDARGPVAAFLIERAGEKRGIILRAVPAIHWPSDVEATDFTRPAPILTIR